VPGGSVAAEALSIGELKRMAIFHIAMNDPTGKQIAVTGKAFSMAITRQLALD
jgi:hypothetical protein